MGKLDVAFLGDDSVVKQPTSNIFSWGTVGSIAPFAIRMDGDDVPMAITPTTLVDLRRLKIGSRVWCQLNGRSLIVLGANAGGVSYDTDPQPLSMASNWVNYGQPYGGAFYYIQNNRVYVEGLVKNGVAAGNTTMATLPVGFRPSNAKVFVTAVADIAPACRIDVMPTGLIVAQTNVNSNYTAFEGINFRLPLS